MVIKVGDSLPNASLKALGRDGLFDVAITEICATGTTVIFALPGLTRHNAQRAICRGSLSWLKTSKPGALPESFACQ